MGFYMRHAFLCWRRALLAELLACMCRVGLRCIGHSEKRRWASLGCNSAQSLRGDSGPHRLESYHKTF